MLQALLIIWGRRRSKRRTAISLSPEFLSVRTLSLCLAAIRYQIWINFGTKRCVIHLAKEKVEQSIQELIKYANSIPWNRGLWAAIEYERGSWTLRVAVSATTERGTAKNDVFRAKKKKLLMTFEQFASKCNYLRIIPHVLLVIQIFGHPEDVSKCTVFRIVL